MIRGIRPFSEICDKAVLLRVEMDVMYQLHEITVRCDRDPAKAMFKQAAGTLIDLVDGLGVGVEKVGEVLIDLRGFRNLEGLVRDLGGLFDAYQQMKVIAEQAIGKCVGNGFDVVSVEPEKIGIVAFFSENVLAVDATIIDVIIDARLESDGLLHKRLSIDLGRPSRFSQPRRSRSCARRALWLRPTGVTAKEAIVRQTRTETDLLVRL